jgi:HAD superfamily hydrolase (TIGR01484 family)
MMRYHVLATDYDGTLAAYQRVTPDTLESLKRLKCSGRKLILVTGRQIPDLINLFPEYALFDSIVAENGAVLYTPATLEEKLLGARPPDSFIDRLRALNVEHLELGRVIIATRQPQQTVVLNAIAEAGLEHQVIFNKGAVMILPPGINKRSGLHFDIRT